MIYYTGEEIMESDDDGFDVIKIQLLCRNCHKVVGYVSMRELAGISISGEPALCFECEGLDAEGRGTTAPPGLSNRP